MSSPIALALNAVAYVSGLDMTLEGALLRLDFRASLLCLIQVPLHLRGLRLHLCLCQVGRDFTAHLLNILADSLALFPLLPSSSLGAEPSGSRRQSSSTTTRHHRRLDHPWFPPPCRSHRLVSLLIAFLAFNPHLFLCTSLGLRKPQLLLQFHRHHRGWSITLLIPGLSCRPVLSG